MSAPDPVPALRNRADEILDAMPEDGRPKGDRARHDVRAAEHKVLVEAGAALDHKPCRRCGRRGEILSSRFGPSCFRCYHAAIPPDEAEAAKRIGYQREIATAIRSGDEAGRFADHALLIETAGSADEVLVLLDRLEALGVVIERRTS
jgi:recombinational DNA repair protein (RecF pathway)